MKRKILLALAVLALVVCALTISVSAATPDNARGVAKYDTEKALYDENGEALTWYVNASDQTVCDLTKNVIQLSSNGTMTYISDKVPSSKNVVIANFKNADGSDVTIDGSSIVYFSHEMFRASANLTHIYIPTSLVSLSSNTGDPRNTFRECSSIAQVWFPEDSNVTELGKFTFAKCALIEVNIPKSIVKMGSGENGGWSIFGGCTRLEVVTFAKDSSLTYLPDQCFIDCSSLKEIELPNSIEYVYQRTFQGCSSLEKIKLGYNFAYNANTGNDHNSFTYGTSSLTEVYISANYYKNAPEKLYWVSYVFDGGKNVKYFYTGSASDLAITMENFKTATTNSSTNNANFLNATVITKAQYDASPDDYQNGDYIIIDCNPCEIFFDGNHTSGKPTCDRCGAVLRCENTSHNLEITISYDSFGKDGVKTVKCLDCNSSPITSVAPALFVCKGYSSPIDNENELSISFEINQKALNEYESLMKKSISYGAFAVAKSNLGNADVLSSDGAPISYAIKAAVNIENLASFELRLSGFNTDAQKSALLALGAYVELTDSESNKSYSYIQADNPLENEKYHFISFNEIISSKVEE